MNFLEMESQLSRDSLVKTLPPLVLSLCDFTGFIEEQNHDGFNFTIILFSLPGSSHSILLIFFNENIFVVYIYLGSIL